MSDVKSVLCNFIGHDEEGADSRLTQCALSLRPICRVGKLCWGTDLSTELGNRPVDRVGKPTSRASWETNLATDLGKKGSACVNQQHERV